MDQCDIRERRHSVISLANSILGFWTMTSFFSPSLHVSLMVRYSSGALGETGQEDHSF